MGKVKFAKSGDTIIAKDNIYSINRIEYQAFINGFLEIKFYDSYDNYVEWNQQTDGGKITRARVQKPIERDNLTDFINKRLLFKYNK